MTTELRAHLTEEQFDDLLIGLGTDETRSHLAHCAGCRAQIDAFRAAMAQANESSLAWSRVRAAGMANPSVGAGSHRLALTTMRWAMACLLMAVLALPIWHSLEQRPLRSLEQPMTGSISAPTEDSEPQIAKDNQLLQEVDTALNANETSPLEEFTASDRTQAKAARQ
jgi:hypothetical protein